VPHPDQSIGLASRRVFLRGLIGAAGAGSLATLTGCDIFGSKPPAAEPVPPVLQGFLAATNALGDRYDATLAAVDSLPATVGQIRDAHRAHAKALAQAIGAQTPSPGQSASAAPTDKTQAISALLAAERAAHDQAVKECLDSPARFAPLLASIAAARATHVVGLS
jgi:hypothetical protein